MSLSGTLRNSSSNKLVDTLYKLKKELAILENEFDELVQKKASMEKKIQEFNYKYAKELGELLKTIEKLRFEKIKKKYKTNSEKYKQAKKEYEKFEKEINDTVSLKLQDLNDEDRELLKKKYRKASKLCHPDRIADEFKEEAAQIFSELNEAYKNNDLEKVDNLLTSLENETKIPIKTKKISGKEELMIKINRLKIKIKKLKSEIEDIVQSEIYKLITSIINWDEHILFIKRKLEVELEMLKNE